MRRAKPTTVKPEYMQKLLQRINRKDWWHVPPQDPQSYSKRGKFLSRKPISLSVPGAVIPS